jgi:lipoate-protein ligase A
MTTAPSPPAQPSAAGVALLDLTLPTPEENLALDEALLNEAEQAKRQGEPHRELLRFWESPGAFVVLGSTGRMAEEIQREACDRAGVAVLRRSSGGGTVLMGPGCLCFSLILDLEKRPELRDIHASYRAILGRLAACLAVEGLAHQGISDLAVHGRKVAGNAQRRKRGTLLHHGAILYNFDLPTIAALLKEPARQPDYRAGRPHAEFLTNLARPAGEIKLRLARCWNATKSPAARMLPDLVLPDLVLPDLVLPDLAPLLREKYANPRWIERF